ncbi:hypothetical protein [Nocardioides panacisoli]|uniref:DUF385 domain-containing protein n=1 Tax=Nocardioides panacisoli TaxID=627624 RepID=A0ABP7J2S4_9ACTN
MATTGPTRAPSLDRPVAAAPIRQWIALCAAAEAVGMSAAAAASCVSNAAVGDPTNVRRTIATVAIIVAGGLVEGTALGLAQASGLRSWRPRLRTTAYVLVTVAVAGVGWAAGSLPAALSGPGSDDSAGPALWLVLPGAAALGATMGALLGAGQALALRRQLPHPWRWVGLNAVAWMPVMALMFLGASVPGSDWPTAAVVGDGTVTGLVAGAALGAVLGWALPSLDGVAPHNRVLLALLGTRRTPFSGALLGLRVRGVTSGRAIELPVMYAADDDGLVVLPGRPESKRWWRNLRTAAPVAVLRDGRWTAGEGVVLRDADDGYARALESYRRRWPRTKVPDGAPLVRIRHDHPVE